jgi:hypothetical protein
MPIYVLPKEEKDRLKEKWSSIDWEEQASDINSLIEFMYSQELTDEELQKHYNKFILLDKYRNESTIDVVKKNYPTLIKYFNGQE